MAEAREALTKVSAALGAAVSRFKMVSEEVEAVIANVGDLALSNGHGAGKSSENGRGCRGCGKKSGGGDCSGNTSQEDGRVHGGSTSDGGESGSTGGRRHGGGSGSGSSRGKGS